MDEQVALRVSVLEGDEEVVRVSHVLVGRASTFTQLFHWVCPPIWHVRGCYRLEVCKGATAFFQGAWEDATLLLHTEAQVYGAVTEGAVTAARYTLCNLEGFHSNADIARSVAAMVNKQHGPPPAALPPLLFPSSNPLLSSALHGPPPPSLLSTPTHLATSPTAPHLAPLNNLQMPLASLLPSRDSGSLSELSSELIRMQHHPATHPLSLAALSAATVPSSLDPTSKLSPSISSLAAAHGGNPIADALPRLSSSTSTSSASRGDRKRPSPDNEQHQQHQHQQLPAAVVAAGQQQGGRRAINNRFFCRPFAKRIRKAVSEYLLGQLEGARSVWFNMDSDAWLALLRTTLAPEIREYGCDEPLLPSLACTTPLAAQQRFEQYWSYVANADAEQHDLGGMQLVERALRERRSELTSLFKWIYAKTLVGGTFPPYKCRVRPTEEHLAALSAKQQELAKMLKSGCDAAHRTLPGADSDFAFQPFLVAVAAVFCPSALSEQDQLVQQIRVCRTHLALADRWARDWVQGFGGIGNPRPKVERTGFNNNYRQEVEVFWRYSYRFPPCMLLLDDPGCPALDLSSVLNPPPLPPSSFPLDVPLSLPPINLPTPLSLGPPTSSNPPSSTFTIGDTPDSVPPSSLPGSGLMGMSDECQSVLG